MKTIRCKNKKIVICLIKFSLLYSSSKGGLCMLNQVILVGRLTKDPEVVKTDSGKKISTVTLAVQRSFKNSNGIYETDFINCVLWEAIASNTSEYCHKGDIVGVKGRLQTRTYEKEDKTTHYVIEVVAEKVTFLSNKKTEEQENP